MNISFIKLLKEQLHNNVTISFELYDIDSKHETPSLEIIGGNNIQIDLSELQEEFIDLIYDILNNNPLEDNEYIGLRVQPKLNHNDDLVIFYESIIDSVYHENYDNFLYLKSELENLDTEKIFDFLPDNYSLDNYFLSVDILFNSTELTVNHFNLNYADKDKIILIKNIWLKNELLKRLEISIKESSIVLCILPKYKNNLEIRVIIENNETVVFKEYFNKRKFIPELDKE